MKVEYGTPLDIESWMELVQSVSWNFPGLETEVAIEDHRQTVLRFMGENRALCVKDVEKVVGVLLLSKNTILFAVWPLHRNTGETELQVRFWKRHLQNLTDPRILLLPLSGITIKKELPLERYISNLVL